MSDIRVPYTYYTLPHTGKPDEITHGTEYVTGTNNYSKYLVKGLEQNIDT